MNSPLFNFFAHSVPRPRSTLSFSPFHFSHLYSFGLRSTGSRRERSLVATLGSLIDDPPFLFCALPLSPPPVQSSVDDSSGSLNLAPTGHRSFSMFPHHFPPPSENGGTKGLFHLFWHGAKFGRLRVKFPSTLFTSQPGPGAVLTFTLFLARCFSWELADGLYGEQSSSSSPFPPDFTNGWWACFRGSKSPPFSRAGWPFR